MTRTPRRRHRAAVQVAAGLALFLSAAAHADDLEVVASMARAPGNITVSSTGRIFISLHQLYQP